MWLHDRLEIAGLAEHRQLLIGARAFAQHRVHVLDRLAAPQLVDHIVDELEQLEARSRIGTSARLPKSISLPSSPQRAARHLFSSMSARR